jgi:hypothetical protein
MYFVSACKSGVKLSILITKTSSGSIEPTTNGGCMWSNDGMTTDRVKWMCLKNYLTRYQYMSRILHGKIIPELNPKPRVHKSANPYVVSLPTAILQCDILYNNDIYININEGGGSGSGSNAHL